MSRSRYDIQARAVAGLAILLASSSCMPALSRVSAGRATVAAVAPPSPSTGTAAPAALLLRPPAGVVADVQDIGIAPPFVAADLPADTAARAADCLTAAIYYEARSEPADGQRAVAQVVLNRVRNPAFPASVCGVVYQRAGGAGGCQFSFACDGSMLRPRDPTAWRRAGLIAADALAGHVYAPAGAATFYHTTSVSPWWAASLARVATIGAHIFYRLGDGWRAALDFRQAYAGAEPLGRPVEDDDRLATLASRFALQGGGSVAVHSGAMLVAGVTVHRGGEPPAPADDGEPAVRVHSGEMPAGADPSSEG